MAVNGFQQELKRLDGRWIEAAFNWSERRSARVDYQTVV
jgi:hypothetical protein